MIKYTNKHYPANPIGFIAYYETVRPIPDDVTLMAASLMGAYYPHAVAFLTSPSVDVPVDGYCLTFSYSKRSNLRVKVTSHKDTTTLAKWVADGGRAFHRASLALPYGIYKLILETTDVRRDFAMPQTPYNRYPVTVDEINIHPIKCLNIGKFTFIKYKIQIQSLWSRFCPIAIFMYINIACLNIHIDQTNIVKCSSEQ